MWVRQPQVGISDASPGPTAKHNTSQPALGEAQVAQPRHAGAGGRRHAAGAALLLELQIQPREAGAGPQVGGQALGAAADLEVLRSQGRAGSGQRGKLPVDWVWHGVGWGRGSRRRTVRVLSGPQHSRPRPSSTTRWPALHQPLGPPCTCSAGRPASPGPMTRFSDSDWGARMYSVRSALSPCRAAGRNSNCWWGEVGVRYRSSSSSPLSRPTCGWVGVLGGGQGRLPQQADAQRAHSLCRMQDASAPAAWPRACAAPHTWA